MSDSTSRLSSLLIMMYIYKDRKKIDANSDDFKQKVNTLLNHFEDKVIFISYFLFCVPSVDFLCKIFVVMGQCSKLLEKKLRKIKQQ